MTKRDQTVLIVGAGASNALHPQFALGGELLQQISDRVTDRTSIHQPNLSNLYRSRNFDYSTCWQFVHHLDEYKRNAKHPSIDEFLNEIASYPEFRNSKDKFLEIGKFAIMFHILGYEGELNKTVAGGLKEDSWLNLVAKYIDENKILDTHESNDYSLKIITFNYDRNIEHFLYENSRFSNRKEEIKSFINNSITHVYGKIGYLPWQVGEPVFAYGEDNSSAEKIFSEMNSIDIMYPDRTGRNHNESNTARNWIHADKTARVCAFGFNFDLINYRVLYLQNIGVKKIKLIANVYPYGDATFNDRREMASRIRGVIHDSEITYMTCTDFVNYVLYEYH